MVVTGLPSDARASMLAIIVTVRTETGETFELKDGQALCASGDFTGAKWEIQAESSAKAVFVPVKRVVHGKDSGEA